MRSAFGLFATPRRVFVILAVVVAGFGFAGKADAQALSHCVNHHPPIQLRYPPPPGYSWVAHPNPYCSYGIAGPTDRPGQPVSGVGLPPFAPGMPRCQTPCEKCCAWFHRCCNHGWFRGPMSPYGYAPGTMVRSPRDYFMQPGY